MEGLGAILASERLDEDDVGMAFWPTFDLVLSLVAKAFVEPRGLKAVCCEDHLCAAATNGLPFGSLQECLSHALTSMVLTDPEVRDLGAASPSVPTKTCDDFASFILNVCPKELSIKVPCSFGVELVDALREECVQLLALSFVEQHYAFGLHGT